VFTSRHRPPNLPETRHKTQRWQSVGQRVVPELIGQSEKETSYTLQHSDNFHWKEWQHILQ